MAGVAPGDVLAGKYRVERLLGVGGMGVVVAAHHIQLDERVALKFLLPETLRIPEAVARFVREARAAVKIKSEYVARVTDVGQLETGSPYMVMEYLEGGDLSGWLRQRGPMSVEQAVEFVLQASEAIAEAHTLGIVHRDLKPANLFCVRRADGLLSVKVLDFGISKLTASGGSAGVTKTTAVMGSPLYMSPEQIQSSKGVDSRTDIWSLGVILFELVTGQLPFEADQVMELVVRIATVPPRTLRALRPDLPPGFEQVVMRCLEKDRDRRTRDVGELACALKDYAPRRAAGSVERILRTLEAGGAAQVSPPGVGTGASGSPAVPAATPTPGTPASWGHTGAGARRQRAPSRATWKIAGAIGAVCLLGVALVAGIVAVRGRLARTTQAQAGVVISAAPRGAPSVAASASAPEPASSEQAPWQQTPGAAWPSLPAASAVEPDPATTIAAQSTPATFTAPSPKPEAARPHSAAPAAAPPAARPAAAPAAPAAVKPNCDPPYFYDAKGRRVFKQECL
jgi:serine/threonine-protein kinase